MKDAGHKTVRVILAMVFQINEEIQHSLIGDCFLSLLISYVLVFQFRIHIVPCLEEDNHKRRHKEDQQHFVTQTSDKTMH